MTEAFLTEALELLAIPSTADRPADLKTALRVIERQLAGTKGVTVEHFTRDGKPSLLAYFGSVRPKTFKVLLNGHVDVVAAQSEQFVPRIDGQRLFARGALDMKVAALVLTKVFCELAPVVRYPLGLQIVTDEEIGGAHGTGYQLEQGVHAEFVISGEFTPAATICTESRGLCWAEAIVHGQTAHGAYLWQGTNAVLEAQKYIAELLADYPIPKQEAWATTVNIASLDAHNTTFNQVPDQAVIKLDIRFIADDPNFANRDTALRYLQSMTSSATIKLKQFEPSHYVDQKNAFVQTLAKAIQQTIGQKANFWQKHGAADIRYYSAQGIPAVALGLQGSGLHGDGEYVDTLSVVAYDQILQKFLRAVS